MVSNTAQLLTYPDHVKLPEAGTLEGKPNSSLQIPQKLRTKQDKEIKTNLN